MGGLIEDLQYLFWPGNRLMKNQQNEVKKAGRQVSMLEMCFFLLRHQVREERLLTVKFHTFPIKNWFSSNYVT